MVALIGVLSVVIATGKMAQFAHSVRLYIHSFVQNHNQYTRIYGNSHRWLVRSGWLWPCCSCPKAWHPVLVVLGQAPNVEIVSSYRLRIHLEGLLRQLGVIAVGSVGTGWWFPGWERALKLRLWASWEVLRDWNGLNLFKFIHCTLHFGSFGHDRTLMLRCSFVQHCFFFARMAEMLQGTVLLCNQQISCTNDEGTTTQLR